MQRTSIQPPDLLHPRKGADAGMQLDPTPRDAAGCRDAGKAERRAGVPFKGLVRIHVDLCELTVHSPAAASPLIKEIPQGERLWDADERCWRVQLDHLDLLVLALEKAGWSVRVIRRSTPTPPVRMRTREIRGAW